MKVTCTFLGFISFLLRARIKGHKVVVFELPMLGELPYILPLLRTMTQLPSTAVVLACREYHDFAGVADSYLGAETASRIFITDFSHVDPLSRFIDIFITPEQFNLGRPLIYSICIFHGQPSKGITFTKQIIESFDMFFFIGPLHRAALDRFVRTHTGEFTHFPEIFEAGYPKLDDLLNKSFDGKMVLRSLGLRCDRKTVLYAPAFNEYATLRTIGLEIIETLKSIEEINVIVKLAPDSINSPDNYYATGGVDWKKYLRQVENDRCRIADSLDINPYLEAADIMVTDVSGVAYDFLVLDKPVVYYDCPDFYEKYVPRFDTTLSVVDCLADDTINAGRNYGKVVRDLGELRMALVERLFTSPEHVSTPLNLQMKLLYAAGGATNASTSKISDLLATGPIKRTASPKSRILGRIAAAVKTELTYKFRNGFSSLLRQFGYRLSRTGLGYIDAKNTVREARRCRLPVCEYLESLEDNPLKRGRRDRIIERLDDLGVFENCSRVCEIGAGTGMYLEKVLGKCAPIAYEIYETDRGWVQFLRDTYGANGNGALHLHNADGLSLKDTLTCSCDLVHAHGVFVYLPLLQTFEYLKEASRVCRSGGRVVFDCYPDTTFTLSVAQKWLDSKWRFPVIIPENLLLEYAHMHGLQLIQRFRMIHGAADVDYLVFQKN